MLYNGDLMTESESKSIHLPPATWVEVERSLRSINELLTDAPDRPVIGGTTKILKEMAKLVGVNYDRFRSQTGILIEKGIIKATPVIDTYGKGKQRPVAIFELAKPALPAIGAVITVPKYNPWAYKDTKKSLDWGRIAYDTKGDLEPLYSEIAAELHPPATQEIGSRVNESETLWVVGWFEQQYTSAWQGNPMKPFLGDLYYSIKANAEVKPFANEEASLKIDPHLVTRDDLIRIVRLPIDASGEIDNMNQITDINAHLVTLTAAAIKGDFTAYKLISDQIYSWDLNKDLHLVLKQMDSLAKCQNLAEVVEFVIRYYNKKLHKI